MVLIFEKIELKMQKKNSKSNLKLMDARTMDFQNDSFDIVLAFTLFS